MQGVLMAIASRVMKKTKGKRGWKTGEIQEPTGEKTRKRGEEWPLERREGGEHRKPVRGEGVVPVEMGTVAQREGAVWIVKEQDNPTDASISGIQEREGLAVHPGRAGERGEGRGVGRDLDAGDAVDIQEDGHDKNLRETREARGG